MITAKQQKGAIAAKFVNVSPLRKEVTQAGKDAGPIQITAGVVARRRWRFAQVGRLN
jgi:hypothetical protein